jgi:hypothetical protein
LSWWLSTIWGHFDRFLLARWSSQGYM